MQQHRSFGDAGGAARIHEQRSVPGGYLHGAGLFTAVGLHQVKETVVSGGDLDAIALFFLFHDGIEETEHPRKVILDIGDDDIFKFCFGLNLLHQFVEAGHGNNCC